MYRPKKGEYYDSRFNNEDGDDEDEEQSKEAAADPLIGKMLKTRKILISGEINKTLAERTIRQLFLLDDMGKEDILIFIDSPGGDADAGFAIFDMIRFIAAPVWTIGMGLVASAAAIIQLASPKERRIGIPNSRYLIHQPLSGIRGVATDIEIHARELEKLREKINRLISEETGKPVEQVEKDTDRDYWMSAGEAAEYGLILKVIAKESELPIVKQSAPEEKSPPPVKKAKAAPTAKTAKPSKTAKPPAKKASAKQPAAKPSPKPGGRTSKKS